MKYYSTNKKSPIVTFREAIYKGLPDDNGLYLPIEIPVLPTDFFEHISDKTLPEIGFQVARNFIGDEIPENDLEKIIAEVLNFDIPLKEVAQDVYALELYHGPTYAFKDVGARFLARCLSYFVEGTGNKLTILVATSGDTGSAVANGFYQVEGIDVVLLYPGGGKVSKIQEQQLTTLGGNITAIEIDGTFDDCQHMVKEAFLDQQLAKKRNLTSANSINIARLIPQSFYYFHALAKLGHTDKPVVFSVPSGNYGNLSAGLMARQMGLEFDRMLACSNINNVVPEYLRSGKYEPRPSRMTVSNAMDVGNPSNFARMQSWYGKSADAMNGFISGYWYDDEITKKCLKEVYLEYNYLMDPHGAIGYLGLKEYQQRHEVTGIFLETAHPAKFIDVVEEAIDEKIDLPKGLAQCLDKKKEAIRMSAEYSALKEYLMEEKPSEAHS
ncbi:MAG: threonine synthase [Cyclobacteriaceae bacterium]